MTKSTSSAATTSFTSAPHWQSIILPLIAGLLHAQVFYYAAFHCIYRTTTATSLSNNSVSVSISAASQSTTDEFRHECFVLDRAIFFAYVFDLLCCYLKVIPFSRCNCSKDIIGHHLPTLLVALPLAIPLWGNIRQLENTSFSILDFQIGDKTRNEFVNAYTMASGFAYISSLNEVFMCFQRVEMNWHGITNFGDISKLENRFFTSRRALGAELLYKLVFFWGMSLVACKACCDFDKSLYDAIVFSSSSHAYNEESIWRILLTVYSSPAVLRGALFRAFSIVMYPSMGLRCLKKFKYLILHNEENEGKKIDTSIPSEREREEKEQ